MTLAEDPAVRDVTAARGGPFHTVEHHAEVTSTNDVALTRLRDGADPGVVVVADSQTAGRGRRGRRWTDEVTGPHGPANLAVTATATAPPPAESGLVPLAAGLAVASAYAGQGADPELKWPNDVLLDGRKAAGILVERHRVGPHDVVLVGCGLDLDWRGVPRPDDATAWTSVAESTGTDVDRARILADLLASLGAWLREIPTDPDGVLAAYRQACATVGRRVRVALPDGETLEGEADLAADGRLAVTTPAGVRLVGVGDVHHLRDVRARGAEPDHETL